PPDGIQVFLMVGQNQLQTIFPAIAPQVFETEIRKGDPGDQQAYTEHAIRNSYGPEPSEYGIQASNKPYCPHRDPYPLPVSEVQGSEKFKHPGKSHSAAVQNRREQVDDITGQENQGSQPFCGSVVPLAQEVRDGHCPGAKI